MGAGLWISRGMRGRLLHPRLTVYPRAVQECQINDRLTKISFEAAHARELTIYVRQSGGHRNQSEVPVWRASTQQSSQLIATHIQQSDREQHRGRLKIFGDGQRGMAGIGNASLGIAGCQEQELE